MSFSQRLAIFEKGVQKKNNKDVIKEDKPPNQPNSGIDSDHFASLLNKFSKGKHPENKPNAFLSYSAYKNETDEIVKESSSETKDEIHTQGDNINNAAFQPGNVLETEDIITGTQVSILNDVQQDNNVEETISVQNNEPKLNDNVPVTQSNGDNNVQQEIIISEPVDNSKEENIITDLSNNPITDIQREETLINPVIVIQQEENLINEQENNPVIVIQQEDNNNIHAQQTMSETPSNLDNEIKLTEIIEQTPIESNNNEIQPEQLTIETPSNLDSEKQPEQLIIETPSNIDNEIQSEQLTTESPSNLDNEIQPEIQIIPCEETENHLNENNKENDSNKRKSIAIDFSKEQKQEIIIRIPKTKKIHLTSNIQNSPVTASYIKTRPQYPRIREPVIIDYEKIHREKQLGITKHIRQKSANTTYQELTPDNYEQQIKPKKPMKIKIEGLPQQNNPKHISKSKDKQPSPRNPEPLSLTEQLKPNYKKKIIITPNRQTKHTQRQNELFTPEQFNINDSINYKHNETKKDSTFLSLNQSHEFSKGNQSMFENYKSMNYNEMQQHMYNVDISTTNHTFIGGDNSLLDDKPFYMKNDDEDIPLRRHNRSGSIQSDLLQSNIVFKNKYIEVPMREGLYRPKKKICEV